MVVLYVRPNHPEQLARFLQKSHTLLSYLDVTLEVTCLHIINLMPYRHMCRNSSFGPTNRKAGHPCTRESVLVYPVQVNLVIVILLSVQ